MSQARRPSGAAPRPGRPAAKPPRAAAPDSAPSRPRGAAREALLEAARAEFDEHGFDGTDTNRIARRAGYAPQTFYRHFTDKTAVFVATYDRWLAEEWKDLDKAHGRGPEEAARVLLRHHARHRGFRRSLRLLTTSDERVRLARADSRRRQLELLGARDAGRPAPSRAVRVALLLCIERIADAAADGELDDLGIRGGEQVAMLAEVLRRLGRAEPPSARKA